ncbi:MAG: response regulator [Candidatus Brocadiales bacterium]
MMTKTRILLIDCEETHRNIYASFLRYEGYSVTTAPDGIEGMGLLRKGCYDLVLCSSEMPYMTGVEVARAVKEFFSEKKQKTPIVLITGSSRQIRRAEKEDNGIDVVMTKPLKLEQLLETVKTLSCS